MTKLICPECGRENEPERIYCHDCGARLDRSALAAGKPVQEEAKQTQRRLRRMLNPQGALIKQRFLTVCKVILGACATAALIEMISPPEVALPGKTVVLPPQINFDLENAALYHRPPQLQYTQEQVNAYLTYTLRNKQNVLNKPLLEFKRAVVGFGEGTCSITIERSLFGYSIYNRSSYRVDLREGKISASNNGGWIGRLPLYPQIMQFTDIMLADVCSALDRERKLVAKMGGIEFHDKNVILKSP
jgi:hypothetical protein